MTGVLPSVKGKPLSRSTEYDTAVDIFSCGIILWQVVTRKVPYEDIENTFDIEISVARGTLRPSTAEICMPRIRRIIETCWAHEPQDRPTAVEVALRLESPLLFEKTEPSGDEEAEIQVSLSDRLQAFKACSPLIVDVPMPFHFAPKTTNVNGEFDIINASVDGLSLSSESADITNEQLDLIDLIRREVDLIRTHKNAHMSVAAMVDAMRQPDIGLCLANHRFFGKTIPNSFVGSQMIHWLTKIAGLSEKNAREVSTMIRVRGTLNDKQRAH